MIVTASALSLNVAAVPASAEHCRVVPRIRPEREDDGFRSHSDRADAATEMLVVFVVGDVDSGKRVATRIMKTASHQASR